MYSQDSPEQCLLAGKSVMQTVSFQLHLWLDDDFIQTHSLGQKALHALM